MIRLQQFATPKSARFSLSPFCAKVEIFLRMAKIPYEIDNEADPRKTPLGKLPVLIDEQEGERTVIADSSSIVQYLIERYAPQFDQWLTPAAAARAHAFTRMLEEHTYWGLVYSRWIEPANWPNTRAALFGRLPPPLRWLLPPLIQRKVGGQLHGHGLGRHPPAEVYRRTAADLGALLVELSDRAYFQGERPCSADATVFAFLEAILTSKAPAPFLSVVSESASARGYCERMRALCDCVS